jgi:hypothetical protein
VTIKPDSKLINRFKKQATSGDDDDVKKCITDIRSDTAVLRTMVKELVGRFRSKRYFNAVRNVLSTSGESGDADHAILSCCGHSGKLADIRTSAKNNKCGADGCNAFVQAHNIIEGVALGTDRRSGHFGYKLETLISLIKSTPKNDRVLVFVQFQDLFDKVHEALTVYGIPTSIITGTTANQSKALDLFQDPDKPDQKVLLLLATDSSSSGSCSRFPRLIEPLLTTPSFVGANLTIANHAFFVSPLLTETKSHYKAFVLFCSDFFFHRLTPFPDSLATQAIGRIHRFGQSQVANIYHLLVHDSLDIRTYGERNDIGNQDNVFEKMADAMKNQERKRDEIVIPQRKKLHKWTPTTVQLKGKAAKAAKAKKADEDDDQAQEEEEEEEEEESDDDVGEAEEEDALPAAPVKGRGKKKAQQIDITHSDDEDDEVEASDASDEEESAEETDDDDDAVRRTFSRLSHILL